MQIDIFGRSFDRGAIIGLLVLAAVVVAGLVFGAGVIFPPAITVISVETVDAVSAVDRITFERPLRSVLMGPRRLKYLGPQRILVTRPSPNGHYLLLDVEIAQRHVIRFVERDQFNNLRIPTDRIKVVAGGDELEVVMVESEPLQQPISVDLAVLFPPEPDAKLGALDVPGKELLYPTGKMTHDTAGFVTEDDDTSAMSGWGMHEFIADDGMQITWDATGEALVIETDPGSTAWIQLPPKRDRQKEFFDFTKWRVRLIVRRPPSGSAGDEIRMTFFGEDATAIAAEYATDDFVRDGDVFQFVNREVLQSGLAASDADGEPQSVDAGSLAKGGAPSQEAADVGPLAAQGLAADQIGPSPEVAPHPADVTPQTPGEPLAAAPETDDGPQEATPQRLADQAEEPTTQVVRVLGDGQARRVAISRNGRVVALAGEEVVEIFDAKSGALISSITTAAAPVNALSISSDGRYLVAATSDGQTTQVELWRCENGDSVRSVQIDEPDVGPICLADNVRVATIALSDTLSVWDTKNNKLMTHLPTTGRVERLQMTPNNRIVCALVNGELFCYDIAKGDQLCQFRPDQQALTDIVVLGSGRRLLLSSYDARQGTSNLLVFDAAQGGVSETLGTHAGHIIDLAVTLDQKILVGVTAADSVHVWNATDGGALGDTVQLPGPTDTVRLLSHDTIVASTRVSDGNGFLVQVLSR